MTTTTFDVVIVGSGFGGSVMAARLGAALKGTRKTIAVVERGRDHTGTFDLTNTDGGAVNAQGNRFRQTLDPSYLSQVARLYTDTSGAFRSGVPSMNVIAGQGIGGGSNAYDGVSLRAPTAAFEQIKDGARLWPAAYTRAALDPYYATVEARLGVGRPAWTNASSPYWQLCTKRDAVFADACRKIGASASPLKLADSGDANEGWWNQGQRFKGRNDLSGNYLADARAAGVTFLSGREISKIVQSGSGYALSGTDLRAGARTPFSLEAKLVVVASGAVGSSALLLQSQGDLAPLADVAALGRYLSANGDYGVNGNVGASYADAVQGFKGKPMSSFCASYFAASQFIVIPFYTPPLYLALGQPAGFLRNASSDFVRGGAKIGVGDDGATDRDFGAAYKARVASFGDKTLTMGCLAFDDAEGEVAIGTLGAEVRWPETSAATDARWGKAYAVMQQMYKSLGGEIWLDGYRKDGTVSTAHPLGGCRMNDDPSGGVVDPFGEAHGLPNLFVVDGAVIPSALGVNPSLTIAAVAEKIADDLVRGSGTTALADRL